jgi:hypothetical protein
MKKIIFLLLMAVAMVGFLSAGAAHPPGDNTQGITILAEYGVHEDVVSPATVQTFKQLVFELSGLFNIANNIAWSPQYFYLIKPINTGQKLLAVAMNDAGYWLRL